MHLENKLFQSNKYDRIIIIALVHGKPVGGTGYVSVSCAITVQKKNQRCHWIGRWLPMQ
jgi:acetyl-CoA carboxylase carboxyltransferase component